MKYEIGSVGALVMSYGHNLFSCLFNLSGASVGHDAATDPGPGSGGPGVCQLCLGLLKVLGGRLAVAEGRRWWPEVRGEGFR